jgi:hypothetical protein
MMFHCRISEILSLHTVLPGGPNCCYSIFVTGVSLVMCAELLSTPRRGHWLM